MKSGTGRLLLVFLGTLLSAACLAAQPSDSPRAPERAAPARVPLGIYVMVRPSQIMQEHYLEKILKNDWVAALAIGLEWGTVFPGSLDGTDFSALDALLSKVDDVCAKVGRPPIPIFLKTYPLLPSWMEAASPVPSQKESILRNKIGMLVVSRPRHSDASGLTIPRRDFPISTDKRYAEAIKILMKKLADWLDHVDPGKSRIPMINVIGPDSESNTMRPPRVDFYWNTDNQDAKRLGWSKRAHITAWKAISAQMSEFPAFAGRYWVFNITNLRASDSGVSKSVELSMDDQKEVVDNLRAVHPSGTSYVLLKTEDLTVDFNNVGALKKFRPGGNWRDKYAQGNNYPYDYVASQFGLHGWELWASFYIKRDRRATSLYPVRRLVENSLYLDLNSSAPHKPQGTLWVEIWPDDVVNLESIVTDDPRFKAAGSFFEAWGRELRSALQ